MSKLQNFSTIVKIVKKFKIFKIHKQWFFLKIHTGCFFSKFKQGDFFSKFIQGDFFSKSLQGDFLQIYTGWFFQNSYRVIFWVRSCLLITLIKCLKGHKSLGSLGSVVKGFIVSWVGPRDWPTKGQGRLLSCSGQLKRNNERWRQH